MVFLVATRLTLPETNMTSPLKIPIGLGEDAFFPFLRSNLAPSFSGSVIRGRHGNEIFIWFWGPSSQHVDIQGYI